MDKQLLLDYAEAEANMKKFKKLELELRNKIIKSFRYNKFEGVEHKEFKDGDLTAKIDVTMKLSRALDVDAIETLWSSLSESERDVINHKPSLNLKAFRELLADGGVNKLRGVITEKPAQASLKITFSD